MSIDSMAFRVWSPRRLGMRFASAMAVAAMLAWDATAAASIPVEACRVTNTETGQTYPRLQAAVDTARRGDRLTVRGTCPGTTVLDRGLVIKGLRTRTRPHLAGENEGVVLTVRKGVTATVRDIAIERGHGHISEGGPEKPYNWPAGILNHGNLTLHGVAVKLNRGIGIENAGRLRLIGDSAVRNNGFWSVNEYRGIHNTGTLVLNGTARIPIPTRWRTTVGSS